MTGANSRCWLDRNLGATKVALNSTDTDSYGDLFQWGRGDDGHQIRTPLSGATTGQSGLTSPGVDFLKGSSNWYNGILAHLLWKADGTGGNNPCPSGYRLPTKAEWDTERLSWGSSYAADALESTLKLPMAGYRSDRDGKIYDVGTFGSYWSSETERDKSIQLAFSSTLTARGAISNRAIGRSVRCIKH